MVLVGLALLAFSIGVHFAAFFGARLGVGRWLSGKRQETWGFALVRWGAGLVAWYVAGSLLCAVGTYLAGEAFVEDPSVRVRVSPSGAAARAGLREGDRIVRISGEPVPSWIDLTRVVRKAGNQSTSIEVGRGDEVLTLSITPEGSPPRIGVSSFTTVRSVSMGHALLKGVMAPWNIVRSTAQTFWRMVAGTEPKEVTGVSGIATEIGTASQGRVAPGLIYAAAIGSYALPLLALATAIYELVNRRHQVYLRKLREKTQQQ